jgi:hypothetical protein
VRKSEPLGQSGSGGAAALATGASALREDGDHDLRKADEMVWSRSDVLLRAFEAALGIAVAAVLFIALTGGWLATGAQKFSDWYADQIDGMLSPTVVSNAVTLPRLERANLPLPDRDPLPVFVADDGPRATATTGANASPPTAE